MLHRLSGLLLWTATFSFLLAGIAAFGEQTPSCTITVQPGESIQAAIDAAPEGAVICLTAGQWEESVLIQKCLTLRGEGADRTIILETLVAGSEVLQISAPAGREGISVVIENVAVTLTSRDRFGTGILVKDTALAVITGCSVFGKNTGGSYGIGVTDSAQATIIDCTVFEKNSAGSYGIWVSESAQATIIDCTVTGERYCIGLRESAQAVISGCTISGAGNGVAVHDSAQATITHCVVSDTPYGIVANYSSSAAVRNCIVTGNEVGIIIGDSAQATLSGNMIQENAMAGVSSFGQGVVSGHGNLMVDNGVDLMGNLPGSLRAPLTAASEEHIIYAVSLYPSLQYAVDALLPGGTLVLPSGEYSAGVTITKEITLAAGEGAARETVRLQARNTKTGAFSLVGGADLTITGVSVVSSLFGFYLGGDARATISACVVSGSDYGAILADSSQATLMQNAITNCRRYGVCISAQPCDPYTRSVFSGYITGGENTIAGADEPDGNAMGAVCPDELSFLMTSKGGELDRRPQ